MADPSKLESLAEEKIDSNSVKEDKAGEEAEIQLELEAGNRREAGIRGAYWNCFLPYFAGRGRFYYLRRR